MTVDVDCIVIGAGVVGLAIAKNVSGLGLSCFVLEQEESFGTQISSRNSEVIHAGIYYPKDSLKSRLCVEGRMALYDYCMARGIPHNKCGKLIVATNDAEKMELTNIKTAAQNNGVTELVELTRRQIHKLEPNIKACAALHSPSTGIIDSHAFMLSLVGDIENHGGMVICQTPVKAIDIHSKYLTVRLNDSENSTINARYVINAAGLSAQAIAHQCDGYNSKLIPQLYYVPGRYYTLSGRNYFQRLIYPVPVDGGLGIHATIDLQGQVKFGPDARWANHIDYSVPEKCPNTYIAAIQKYYPGIDPSRLQAGYAGVRPKLAAQGEGFKDFEIQYPNFHECNGLIHLFGIESPGLTASLAIADQIGIYIKQDV